jgi:hypothetical protein
MRLPRSWWAPLVSEGIFHLQLMRAGRALRRARLAAYKSDRRGGRFFTFALSVCCSCPLHSSPRAFLAFAPLFLPLVPRPPPIRMAPQQPITVIDPPAWERSTATTLSLGLLVAGGQLAANVEGQPAEWIVPSKRDRVPNHSYGYVTSFVRFHESRCRRAASCGPCATTTAWSCTTSRRTQSRRRPHSSASAKASWGSR